MTTCNECETVAHCLKHGCIPKVRSTIDMARKAGGQAQQNKNCDVEYVMSSESLQRLVDSVRADEREACAKVCEKVGVFHEVSQGADLAFDLAATIRARGNT